MERNLVRNVKIGFFLEWIAGSVDKNNKWKVFGEELLALGWCQELMKQHPEITADVYSNNKQPEEKLDLMIYMNYNTRPNDAFSDKKIMYVENDFRDKGNLDRIYKRFARYNFDAIMCYSKIGCEYFKQKGYKTYYVPFSVDTEIYNKTYDKDFEYDIAYVGANIKGRAKTKEFFEPTLKYNLGLFGNWKLQAPMNISIKDIFSKGYFDFYDFITLIRYFILITVHRFDLILYKKSKGKISQQDMVKLLSSSKINLNLTLRGNIKLDIINYRIVEVFACKGFIISDYVPVLEDTFKDAIVLVKNKKELKKALEYYINHPQEREIKAQKGYEIVQKHFTSEIRAKELYEIFKEIIRK